MILLRFAFLPALVLTLSGCGGGGESLTSRPRLRVHWPALGRSIQASAYTNSLRITLPNARLAPSNINGIVNNDVVLEVNRTSDADSEAVYTLPADIKPGKATLTVETFSQANQQGRQLQSASATVTPQADGYFPDIDLAAGAEAITSVQISLNLPPAFPPPDPSSLPQVYVGSSNAVYLSLNNISINYSQLSSQELKWIVNSTENADGGVVIRNPRKSLYSDNSYIVDAVNPGVVELKLSIDGIVSNAIKFRVVPVP